MNLSMRILLIANFLNMFGYSLFSPFYAIFAQRINADILIIGGSWGIYSIATSIMLFIFGKLEDKREDKRFWVIIGYFILAFGALSFIFVHTVIQLFAVQVINAVGVGITNPAWKTLYAQREDRGHEAREWSIYDGGNMLFIGIASVLGGFIVHMVGFSSLFLIVFGVQILGAILSLKLLKAKA